MVTSVTMTLNDLIKRMDKEGTIETNGISDGYHTFGELYDHRIALFIALCKLYQTLCATYHKNPVWKSKKHHDGTSFDGWFIMGINWEKGKQISYHLPMKYWNKTKFADELTEAPLWDGHTPADVVKRLLKL